MLLSENLDFESHSNVLDSLILKFISDQAEGKICPHTLKRMPRGMPCTLGSTTVFLSEEIRDKANATYHKYEYKTNQSWKELELSTYAKLAFRLFTMIPKDQISDVLKNMNGSKGT